MTETNYRILFKRAGITGIAETIIKSNSIVNAEKKFYEIFGKKKYQFIRAHRLPVAGDKKIL